MIQKKKNITIVNIVGARPNFIKICPIINQMNKVKRIKNILIHTGQHYDYEMSALFFNELGIKEPEIYLGIGAGSQAEQTAKIMIALEKELMKIKPDLVCVVGDVNSTMAAALVAAKLCIPLAHVEAGLRSRDLTMPEEINRIVTDRLSDLLLTTSDDALDNLLAEGVDRKKIYFTGNVMIDTLMLLKKKSAALKAYKKYSLKKNDYVLVTLHRPSNVESKKNLSAIINELVTISKRTPIIFPIHPRTEKRLKDFGLMKLLQKGNIILTPPIGYIENLSLLLYSKFVITDSGGIQEETTVLHIPCLTLRENTERPVTAEIGTNTVIGLDMKKLRKNVGLILGGKYKKGKIPKYWDGKASERITGIIKKLFLK